MKPLLPLLTGFMLAGAALNQRAHAQVGGFPGQLRPESLAATSPAGRQSGPAAQSIVLPTLTAKPSTTPLDASQQRLQRIKDKVQLGVPLSADETLFVMAWIQQNPFRPESAN